MIIKDIIIPKTLLLTYDPKLIDGFKRRALGTNTEILAFIVGEVYEKKKVSCVDIQELVYPELALSTPTCVETMEGRPDGVVGTIHSHPDCQTIGVSQSDIHSAILDDEKIFGVYTWFRGKRQRRVSELQWFAPGKVVAIRKI